MNAARTIVMFRCAPLRGAELTRTGCASRWEAMNAERAATGRRPGSGSAIVGRECVGCPVGKAHADGERPEAWPDGARIELIDKPVPAAVSPMPRPVRPHQGARTASPPDAPPEPTPGPDGPATGQDAGSGEADPASPIPTGGNADEQSEAVVLPPVEPTMRSARPVVDDGDVGEACIEPMRGRVVTVDGVSRTVEEWARHHGITTSAIYERIRRSWPIELAVSAPRGATYAHATAPKRVRGDAPPVPRVHAFESQRVTHDGRTQDVLAWAHEVGVSIATVRQRVRDGESLERACTTPSKRAPSSSVQPESNVLSDLARAAASHAPADLLRAAGYDVASVSRVPAGLAIVVRIPGA